MKFAEVAENVKQLVDNPPPNDGFIFELLLAYGTPKATIARLKSGQANLAKEPGEVLLKKKVCFKALTTEGTEAQSGSGHEKAQKGTKNNLRKSAQSADEKKSPLEAIEKMKTAKAVKTNDPRFLIVTDFEQILAVDRKTGDTLDIEFQSLETHFTFFLPLAGMEKTKLSNENPADVKAAEKMAKLFDAIRQDNPDYLRHDAHAMNVFLARLLFCLFAEDTGIFPENAVSNAIKSYTAEDGSDLDAFFRQLFDWLDTPDRERELATKNTKGHEKPNLSEPLCGLPYVNGGLFRDHYDIPVFSAKSRRMLIEAGTLTWAEINPDIFGSMFQAVIDPEERHNLGQHYTSVTNIMKVIEPLFLNDFKEELERARNLSQKNVRTKALHDLQDRIAKVKIFDPACGSGNFLIIAYKELRKLEMELFEAMNAFPVSRITVDQFYGIEIDDFACETATLSLWLAEHQMNLAFTKRFGHSLTSLPLKDGAHIVCGNACRIDWETVCPKNENDEIYILGNPPYLGARMQTKEHKADMAIVFGRIDGANSLDYIACWFFKAAQYIRGVNAQFAFVSTNSLCQGEQVALLWPHVLKDDLEIGFAHQSFKWTNNAKGSAAVICVVVGIRNISSTPKLLFHGQHVAQVENINTYLVAAKNVFVERRGTPISRIPSMKIGNKPIDGGHYLFTPDEKESFIQREPGAAPYFRRWYGSQEFLKGIERWCLFVRDIPAKELANLPLTRERMDKVRNVRLDSKSPPTQAIAETPERFHVENFPKGDFIIVPEVSSERRTYIPIGHLSPHVLASNLLNVVASFDPALFGILSSQIHMAWMRAVAGRLKTDYRYSAGIVYNTFPIPDLTEEQKQTITMHVGNVLEEREKHPEKTMAQLYDPDKMPAGLREAHHQLDLAVDRIYRSKPFISDEERLEHLFKLYEEMTAKEKLI
jgi:hypothetical protein